MMQTVPQPLYSLRKLTKEFSMGGDLVRVLNKVDLDVQAGETVAVVGASGSGKSSLLHLLGALAGPTSGELLFMGRSLPGLTPDQKAAVRNRDIGFVFQFHHLLPEFTALENVAMPALIAGEPRGAALAKAAEILKQVGLEQRAAYNVTYLSGGERQRAAIARAVLQRPRVLLADEPTGNLDEKNGGAVTELLLELNHTYAMSIVVVTHNPELAARMDRCLELKSGELYEQKPPRP